MAHDGETGGSEGQHHEGLLALVMLMQGRRALALTGAGVSTDSGIPDYRGEETLKRARNPVRFQTFVESETARQRYWARAFAGWRRIAKARPNPGHQALARLEAAGALVGVVTQNVDRLHLRAGSARVVELHGALHEVRCLACDHRLDRERVQAMMLDENGPELMRALAVANPDGDVELDDEAVAGFRVPRCSRCAGDLKPDVVYFGEPVPKPRVEAAMALLHEADLLLVLGSSLTVFSGYRFVREAVRARKPVAIVNRGKTRGDDDATVRLDGGCSEVLSSLAAALGAR